MDIQRQTMDKFYHYKEIASNVDAHYRGLTAPAYLVSEIRRNAPTDFDLLLAREAVQEVVSDHLDRNGFRNHNLKIHWHEYK